MKKTIRLTESELKHLIRESVNNVLCEKSLSNDSKERKWITYERLVHEIKNAAELLYKITYHQEDNEYYNEIEEPMFNFANAVLRAVEEYGVNNFDPTKRITW